MVGRKTLTQNRGSIAPIITVEYTNRKCGGFIMSASSDLISGLHADVWLDHFKYSKQISTNLFVYSLLPPNPSKVLVIAGDLGDLNSQNELLLHSFKRYYSHI
jgi:hypothetical protein